MAGVVDASPGALVCADVSCTGGKVTFGPGCVVQPRCLFVCEGGDGAAIRVGADCIFEEQCVVVHSGDGVLEIGSLNLFEVGCALRGVRRVGDGNRIGVRAEVGEGVTLGNNTYVAAAVRVAPGTNVTDHTVVMHNACTSADPVLSAKAHRAEMVDCLSALRDPASRTALINFHKILD